MTREHEGEIINYPYAATLVIGKELQLKIRIENNWIPVEKIVSEKMEPFNRFSPYKRTAITKDKHEYVLFDGENIWRSLAVAVTASAQPALAEKDRKKFVPRRKSVRTPIETEREPAVASM